MKKLLILLILPFLSFGQPPPPMPPPSPDNTMWEVSGEEGEILNFAVVEETPTFFHCNKSGSKEGKIACFRNGVVKHIQDNFKYPEFAKTHSVQSKIIISFIIDKQGKVNSAKVVRNTFENTDWKKEYLKERALQKISDVEKSLSLLETEAIRLISSIPDIIPAKQKGKPVSVNFTIPINFVLKN